MLCSEGEREARECKMTRLVQDRAYSVHDGEKMPLFRISTVLKESVTLEKALRLVRTLLSVFGKNTVGLFTGPLQEVLEEGASMGRPQK